MWSGRHSFLTVAQKEIELLKKLQIMFGMGKIYLTKNGIYKGHIWKINGRQAIGLMMTLYPLMSIKRKQKIREVIKNWKCYPDKGSFYRNKTHCKHGHPYNEVNTYIGNRKNGHKYRVCRICMKTYEINRKHTSAGKGR